MTRGGTPAAVAEYGYDDRNERIAKSVDGSPAVTTDYYYNDAWQVLEERKGGTADADS